MHKFSKQGLFPAVASIHRQLFAHSDVLENNQILQTNFSSEVVYCIAHVQDGKIGIQIVIFQRMLYFSQVN